MLASVHLAQAQQAKKVHRIGFLSLSSASGNLPRIEAFRQGLRELGYVEGQSFVIDYPYAEGKSDRLPNLAADLVSLKVDVIVAPGTGPVSAAKQATRTIPIVMVNAADPVGDGFVSSLARPGGNITGLTNIAPDLSGKRLELLKEAVPKASRMAILWNPVVQQRIIEFKQTQVAARALGLQLQSAEARAANDLEPAFSAMTEGRANALIVLGDGMFNANRTRILDLAAKGRLPAMYNAEEYVLAGGLMVYGPSTNDLSRRAAMYVDKILKGAKPADLPVEQPTKFELVVNLKTAKAIGVKIPPAVLARADKVIN
ncbi:MAG: ABC transporter substrate-binding protein [Deltaproteobacteria bacterium]|nr:ABC transporter substrate-binding protein [Deltaproteobacteria bacterium]